jgi:hypothetical protein
MQIRAGINTARYPAAAAVTTRHCHAQVFSRTNAPCTEPVRLRRLIHCVSDRSDVSWQMCLVEGYAGNSSGNLTRCLESDNINN